MQGQSLKPFINHRVPNNSNGSTLYAIKWFKLILGCTSSEMRITLHIRPNLDPIQGWSVVSLCRWTQFLSGHLPGLAFQMITILAVTRNLKAQFVDIGRSYKGSVLFYCVLCFVDTINGFFYGWRANLSLRWIEPNSFYLMRKNSLGMPHQKTQFFSAQVSVFARKTYTARVYIVHCAILCIAINTRIYYISLISRTNSIGDSTQS